MAISRSSLDVDLSTLVVSSKANILPKQPMALSASDFLRFSELARGAKPLIRMQGNQTFLDPPEVGSTQDTKRATERKTMPFSFDKSYWSAGPRDEPGYCSQQTLYDDLGKELLDHGFAGFNACILACECKSFH
jgi:kinesin family protein 1